MTQTYCEREDIEAILSEAGVLAPIDDDQDGLESASDELHIASMIERAAVEMNAAFRHQYDPLSALASNVWCKWANATLAAYYIRSRKGNQVEGSLQDAAIDIRRMINEIRWGRDSIPDQSPTHEHTATVSNFQPELIKTYAPIRVDTEESTGSSPSSAVKRNVAKLPGT